MRRSSVLAAVLLAAGLPPLEAWTRAPTMTFTSARRTFSCDIPWAGWNLFEEDTPFGSSTHVLGPSEAGGAFRAGLHIHFIDKDRAAFEPLDGFVKRVRQDERVSGRTATPIRRWRVAKRSARRFEVRETRQLPNGHTPSRGRVLHHYYAVVPAGDGYFVVKLSTTEETYLEHRESYEHLLNTFRILGYE